jgi:2-aminoadipate transaminase
LITSGGLERNIQYLRAEYAARRDALGAALRQYLPEAQYTVPHGGFFFWVRLPEFETAGLRPRAREFKVDYRQGALFSSGNGLAEYVRLSFCFYKPDEIEQGVRRLSVCLVQD